jgi:hypothetical protein
MSQTDLPEGFGTAAATTRIGRIWWQVLEVQALTPGPAVSERAVRGRLRMFAFDSSVSEDNAAYRAARTVTGDLCGCTAISPDPVSK